VILIWKFNSDIITRGPVLLPGHYGVSSPWIQDQLFESVTSSRRQGLLVDLVNEFQFDVVDSMYNYPQ